MDDRKADAAYHPFPPPLATTPPPREQVPGPRHRRQHSCSDHRPRQHRDGRRPWCRRCGCDAVGELVRSVDPNPPDPLG